MTLMGISHECDVLQSACNTKSPTTARKLGPWARPGTLALSVQCDLPPDPYLWMPTLIQGQTGHIGQETSRSPK